MGLAPDADGTRHRPNNAQLGRFLVGIEIRAVGIRGADQIDGLTKAGDAVDQTAIYRFAVKNRRSESRVKFAGRLILDNVADDRRRFKGVVKHQTPGQDDANGRGLGKSGRILDDAIIGGLSRLLDIGQDQRAIVLPVQIRVFRHA